MKKVAVVLFNLGGPTSLKGVKPFLFNLFKDPDIIRLPNPLRFFLAWLISTLRRKKAENIYAQLGGKSPLNDNTQKQVDALEAKLLDAGVHAKVFMCMRYAPPMTDDVLKAVAEYQPDEIVLLPLYPQFSTTTVKSSLLEWKKACLEKNFHVKTHSFCCFPGENGFIEAYRELLVEHLSHISKEIPIKILFSAHGIPEDIVKEGDPYPFHARISMDTVMDHDLLKKYEYDLCYQSKVGPKKWTGPSLTEAMEVARNEKKGVVIVPISFVSDHSETLVELDIQYKEYAKEMNLVRYSRIFTVSDHPIFIEGLCQMVLGRLAGMKCEKVCSSDKKMCGYDRFSY